MLILTVKGRNNMHKSYNFFCKKRVVTRELQEEFFFRANAYVTIFTQSLSQNIKKIDINKIAYINKKSYDLLYTRNRAFITTEMKTQNGTKQQNRTPYDST